LVSNAPAEIRRKHGCEPDRCGREGARKCRILRPSSGIIVDYEETACWWQVQDYAFHAFDAAVVLIRVAATTPDDR
jgi:hypothetical protein